MKKLKLKNYHINFLALVFIVITGALIIYSYKYFKTDKTDQKNYSVADAIIVYDGGDQQGAIKILEEIVQNDPDDGDATTRLAMYYYETKNYDKFLDFASKHNQKNVTIYNMMANVYQNMQDTKNAEKYYQLAILTSPKNTQVYINYSAYFQGTGDYQSALNVLEQGLQISPNSTALLNSAASVCLKMGKKEKAVEYASKVLKNDPENTQARAIIESAS